MSAKDCITAYVCMNAEGSEKLPLAIIGKAKNPGCIRFGRPLVPYSSKKAAWRNSSRDNDVRNVMEMLANLEINLDEGDTLRIPLMRR